MFIVFTKPNKLTKTYQEAIEIADAHYHLTGEVYKPASWKAPAKHVRYDLRIIREREFLLNPKNCDWAGGHLYMR